MGQARLLSLGVPGGIVSGVAGVRDGDGVVRLANEFVGLGQDEYRLWDAGFLAPRRDSLARWGADAGVTDPDQVIGVLIAGNLMAVQTDEPAAAAREATRLAVRLTGQLVGNGPHRSPGFPVRATAGDQSTVAVDALIYEFLLRADGMNSIAAQCAQMEALEAGLSAGLQEHVYRWVPILLRNGILALDIATGIV
jgi:hypothetical protein